MKSFGENGNVANLAKILSVSDRTIRDWLSRTDSPKSLLPLDYRSQF